VVLWIRISFYGLIPFCLDPVGSHRHANPILPTHVSKLFCGSKSNTIENILVS